MNGNPKLSFHITPDGSKYYLIDNHPVTNEIVNTGYYDRHLLIAAEHILSKSENGIVLEIGSDIGAYTIPLARKYKKMHFCAFESTPFIFEQLNRNVKVNDLKNIRTFNAQMFSEEKHDYDEQFGLIEYRKLDSYKFNNVRLIRINSEHEFSTLAGATETLVKNFNPAILIHCTDVEKHSNLLTRLRVLNYGFFYTIPNSILAFRNIDEFNKYNLHVEAYS